LTSANVANQPNISPSFWQPLAWRGVTTYAKNAVVTFAGVPWVSLINSNINNTPSNTSTSWQPSWVFIGANGGIYSFNYSFTGNWGLSGGQGCNINPQYDNGVFFWIGPGDGMSLQGVNISGSNPNSRYRGQYPAAGIGVCVANGSGGANRTRIENVGVGQVNTLFKTGCNASNPDGSAGQGALGAENSFRRLFGANCYWFLIIGSSQNDINDVDESSDQCTNHFQTIQGPGIHVSNSNPSTPFGASNTFTISSTSAVTSSGGVGSWTYTFSTTISSPDGNLTCPDTPTVGNCVYNSWVILTPNFGLVPLLLTGWNSSTHVANFQVLQSWGLYFFGTISDATSTTAFSTDIQAATSIYAAEHGYTFQGIGIQADHLHQEVGICNTFFQDTTVFSSERGNVFDHVRFNYFVSQLDQATPIFYCQQAFPFIDETSGFGGATNFEIRGSTFGDVRSANSPVNIDLNANLRCLFDLQDNDTNGFMNPSIRMTRAGGVSLYSPNNGGCEWNTTPFLPAVGIGNYGNVDGVPTTGFFPSPNITPRASASNYALWQSIAGNAINSYPPVSGPTIYTVLTNNPGFPDVGPGKFAQSTHLSYSWGQNLTTSNVSGLSWQYKGQSCFVLASTNTLNAMFPGLGIILDNGTDGPIKYVVTGVFPQVSLDGGTHPGYFTIRTSKLLPRRRAV
jgi:hypothetical protein